MSAFVFFLISLLWSGSGIDTIKIMAALPDSFSVMNPYNARCIKESNDTCVVFPISVVRKTTIAVTERNFFALELDARKVSDSLLHVRIGIDSSELVVVRKQLALSRHNETDLKSVNETNRRRFMLIGAGVGSAATALACILLLVGLN